MGRDRARRAFQSTEHVGGAGVFLSGDKELKSVFMALPKELYSVLGKSTEKAMEIVAEDARRLALRYSDSGLLAESIGVRTKQYRRNATVVTVVGPRRGFRRVVQVTRKLGNTTFTYEETRDPVNYAHLVEYGTQAHDLGKGSRIRKGVSTGGQMHPGAAAKPFMRPAMDANRYRALGKFRTEARDRFIKRVKRLRAKGKL